MLKAVGSEEDTGGMKNAKPSSNGLRQMFAVTAVATVVLGGVLQAGE